MISGHNTSPKLKKFTEYVRFVLGTNKLSIYVKEDGFTSGKNVILGVDGMSCRSCTHSINNAVAALNGVKSVTVDPEGKKVSVEFDDEKISLETIKDVIEDQGYQVR